MKWWIWCNSWNLWKKDIQFDMSHNILGRSIRNLETSLTLTIMTRQLVSSLEHDLVFKKQRVHAVHKYAFLFTRCANCNFTQLWLVDSKQAEPIRCFQPNVAFPPKSAVPLQVSIISVLILHYYIFCDFVSLNLICLFVLTVVFFHYI